MMQITSLEARQAENSQHHKVAKMLVVSTVLAFVSLGFLMTLY